MFRKFALGQRVRGVADLALAGEEHEDVARALALQLGDGVADGLDLVAVRVGVGVVGVDDGPVADLDGVRPAGDLDDRDVVPSASAKCRANRSVSIVAEVMTTLRSGRRGSSCVR